MSLVYVGGGTGVPSGAQGTNPNSAFSISLTALTGGVGSTALENDVVFAFYGNVTTGVDTNQGVTTGGYTQIADLYANDDLDANFTAYYKIMGETPDTTIAFAASGGPTVGAAAVVHVWRNVDMANPLDVAATTATGTNSDKFNSPSITPVTTGAIVLSAGCGTNDTTDDQSITAPTGFGNQKNISRLGTSHAATVGVASIAWTSGALDPTVWGGLTAGSSNSWCAISVAIRPLTSYSRALTAAVTATGSVSSIKNILKALTATVVNTTSVTTTRALLKNIVASVTASASLEKIRTRIIGITATVATAASLTFSIGKVLTATATVTGSLTKGIATALTAGTTATASVTKLLEKMLNTSVATTASLVRQLEKALTSEVHVTAMIESSISILIAATATATATIEASRAVIMNAMATTEASVIKVVGKVLAVTASILSILSAPFWRTKYPPHGDETVYDVKYTEHGDSEDYSIKYPHE